MTAYAVSIPFERHWNVVQRTAAVFALLRLTVRSINASNVERNLSPLRPSALQTAVRSRYRDLYRHAFARESDGKTAENFSGLKDADLGLPDGSLCPPSMHPRADDYQELEFFKMVCLQ
eukprot:SAG31_NODE_3650_length_4028_cov_1.617205_5_plen_119_part_00